MLHTLYDAIKNIGGQNMKRFISVLLLILLAASLAAVACHAKRKKLTSKTQKSPDYYQLLVDNQGFNTF